MNVGTGSPMVAVGLNYASDGASLLKIFSFNGKTLDEICSESYQTKIVYDIDSDDLDEVILVSALEGGLSMEAKLFTYGAGRFLNSFCWFCHAVPKCPFKCGYFLSSG